MKFRLTILSITFLLSGCVGALHNGAEDRSINNPSISEEKGKIGYFSAEKVVQKEELLSKWGKPDKLESKNDTEEWTYILDSNISNSTLLILGVIPVPINLPDEAETVTFVIKDNVVLKANTRFESSRGGVCGFHMGQHFGIEFGCTK